MRPIDGSTFARAVKRLHPNLPIVGMDLDPYRWTILPRQDSGIDGVIMVPFGPTVARRVAFFINQFQINPSQFPSDKPPAFLDKP